MKNNKRTKRDEDDVRKKENNKYIREGEQGEREEEGRENSLTTWTSDHFQ